MNFFKEKKEKHVSKGLKKVDTIVTGLVLGGILASVYGIKKYEDSKKNDKNIEIKEEKIKEKKTGIIKIIFKIIFKKLVGKK